VPIHRFNAANDLRLVHHEPSDRGYFCRIANRIAGDMTCNDASPGQPGGMYEGFRTARRKDLNLPPSQLP
jgi:hypothetical protein